MTENTIPYFVYGTLRPDAGNDHIWEGIGIPCHDGDCWVPQFRLAANPHDPFPYAIPTGDDQSIVGTLIYPVDGACGDVLRERLDMLEGYPVHYDRRLVDVVIDVGVTDTELAVEQAWLYVPSPMTMPRAELKATVANGDWMRHARAKRVLR